MSDHAVTVYSVAPFSLWKDSKSYARGITGRECAICGKQVKEPFKHVAVVIDGGAQWASVKDADTTAPGYMGEFPIGPDCHKKYRLTEEQAN